MDDKANEVAYVLDSFALIAYLEDESGGGQVAQILRRAEAEKNQVFLSLMNYGECLYIVERERGLIQAQDMIATVDQLPIEIIGADRLRVFAAAHLKAHYPLSYADAFAVELAQEFNATIVTGDPEFKRVENLVSILWLPSPPL